MSTDPTSFWSFSITFYKLDGVADACLELQDGPGLDVNLLLFCCWYGRALGVVPAPLWQQVLDFSQPWQLSVVQPLRDARRWLKSTAPAQADPARSELRERIKQDELQAEQYQQTIIEEYARGLTTSASVAGAGSMLAVEQNCEALLGRLGIVLSDREQAVLQRLFNAVSSLEPTPAEYPNSRA